MAASEALAWMEAIFVALFLVLSANFVSFPAKDTSLVNCAISLQILLSVTALVLLPPLATTAVERRRETRMLVNCMLTVLKLRKKSCKDFSLKREEVKVKTVRPKSQEWNVDEKMRW